MEERNRVRINQYLNESLVDQSVINHIVLELLQWNLLLYGFLLSVLYFPILKHNLKEI